MYKILRIAFCIIAAAAAAIAVPVFIFLELWGLVPVGVSVLSTVAMYVCKWLQEISEMKKNPPSEGDFIKGKKPVNKD